MKKTQMILSTIVTLFAAVCSAQVEEPVYFADANLKAAVEEVLGITDPTPTDMLGLTLLEAPYRGIADLTGLEYAANLTWLRLYRNSISDISALSCLTNLTRLSLDQNQVIDISALSQLSHLSLVGLGHNQVSDISPLSGLALTHLDLEYNQISDISALSNMTRLSWLNLEHNQISDISALSNMSYLEHLRLNCNQISDVSALSGLTHLWHLCLYLNQIEDISALSNMSALKELMLQSNQIGDISALADLNTLTHLYLEDNQISSISPLSGMTHLNVLYLLENPLDCPAYNTDIPMIKENNPGIEIYYDPMPEQCRNERPEAIAGEDQRVAVGDTVTLNGSDSWDPDGDPLTYWWSLVAVPVGSASQIADPTAVETSFVPDVSGGYGISLVVNDGTDDSEPAIVVVTAIPPEEAAEEVLKETEELLRELPEGVFQNSNSADALINKLEATLSLLADGAYAEVLDKLQNDILQKTNGCVEIGEPDSNDWIETCDAQAKVYPLVRRAIELLERLVE